MGMELLAAFIFSVGAVICHQLPDRSFFWGGQQFPVCARCTGLYASAAIGLAGWLALKTMKGWRPIALQPSMALRWIAIAAVPTAVSLALGALSVWDGSNVTRAVLAIPLGVSAGAIVAAVATKDLR
jgi:uncharacterized membrane protein